MLRVEGVAHVFAHGFGRAFRDEPGEFAKVLRWLARESDGDFRKSLSSQIYLQMNQQDRIMVRDLALMIAGACGEAE